MPVYLKINKCAECPFKVAMNRAGKLVNVPMCMKAGRELPYTVRIERMRIIGAMTVADPTDEIPAWCPLREED